MESKDQQVPDERGASSLSHKLMSTGCLVNNYTEPWDVS